MDKNAKQTEMSTLANRVASGDLGSLNNLQKSCDSGNAEGCFYLGVLMYSGSGVEHNSKRAAAYFKRACDKNHPYSCSNLALMHASGEGVEQSYTEAKRYYDKSCALGNFSACHDVAVMHLNGEGVGKDVSTAAVYFMKACDENYMPSCAGLALIHHQGDGIQKDNAMAQKFKTKACLLGLKEACDSSVDAAALEAALNDYNGKLPYKLRLAGRAWHIELAEKGIGLIKEGKLVHMERDGSRAWLGVMYMNPYQGIVDLSLNVMPSAESSMQCRELWMRNVQHASSMKIDESAPSGKASLDYEEQMGDEKAKFSGKRRVFFQKKEDTCIVINLLMTNPKPGEEKWLNSIYEKISVVDD